MINVLKFTNNVPDTGSILNGANVNSYNCSNSSNHISISPTTFSGAFDLKYSLNGTNFITLSGQTGYTILISSSYPTFILDESIYNFALTLAISYTTYCDSTKPCGEIFSASYNINKLSVTPTVNQPSSNLIYNRFLFFSDANQSQINSMSGYNSDSMQGILGCENDNINIYYYQRFKNGTTWLNSPILGTLPLFKVQWRGLIGTYNQGTLTRFKLSDSLDTGSGLNLNLANTSAATIETTIKNAIQTTSASLWQSSGQSIDLAEFLAGFKVTKPTNSTNVNFSYNPFSLKPSTNSGSIYSYSNPNVNVWSSYPNIDLGPPVYKAYSASATAPGINDQLPVINSQSYFSAFSTQTNSINLYINNQISTYYITNSGVNYTSIHTYNCNNTNLSSINNIGSLRIAVISPRRYYIYLNYTSMAQSTLTNIDDISGTININNNVNSWNSYKHRFLNLETISGGSINIYDSITCQTPRSVYFNMTGLVGSLANSNCKNIKYKKTGDPTWFYNGSIENSVNNPLPLNTTATSVDYEATAQCPNTTPICNKIQTISV